MKKKEEEKQLLEKLLKSEVFLSLYEYKNINYNREKPDCCVITDNISIGIEVTISIDENLKKTREENKKFKNSVSFCPTLFEQEKMSSKEIETKLKDIQGRPYAGDELEEITFDEIKKSIESKIKKFNNYEKFDKNWLYIYHDNRASLRVDILINYLKNYIEKLDFKFDSIILGIGDEFYKFDKIS